MKTTVDTAIAVMAVFIFAGASAAEAQTPQPRPQQAQPQQKVLNELSAFQERSRKVQEELTAIAQKAVKANPQLMDMHKELMAVYERKLTEYGYPSEEEIQALREMQQKMQTAGEGGVDEAERQRLTDQFNASVAKLQKAQQKAQSDPKVQAAQKKFNQARLDAMQKVNPKTMELQKEQADLQSKIEKLRQSLQTAVQQAPQQ
jgi:hypothetical protein